MWNYLSNFNISVCCEVVLGRGSLVGVLMVTAGCVVACDRLFGFVVPWWMYYMYYVVL